MAENSIAINSCGRRSHGNSYPGKNGSSISNCSLCVNSVIAVDVDREIGGRSSQSISVISSPDTASSGSRHGEIVASFVLPHDKLYRPARSVLDQLASHESSSAEGSDKDHDNRHRAAIALMVYLSTDGIKR